MSTLRTTTAMALMTGAALTASASASAQVYKCPDASGRTVIQQIPCAGGAHVRKVRTYTLLHRPRAKPDLFNTE